MAGRSRLINANGSVRSSAPGMAGGRHARSGLRHVERGATRESHGEPGFSRELLRDGVDDLTMPGGVGLGYHGCHTCLCGAEDLFFVTAADSIKTSGDESGFPRTNAVDGDAASHWSGEPLGVGVDNMWWAADLGAPQLVDAFRLRTDNPGEPGTAQDVATEARLYGTNDPAVWAALTHGSGKMTTDPTTIGWGLVATHTAPLTEPSDSGRVVFTPAEYRYWLWKAISGGTSEWDVNTLELWSSVGTGTGAARCDHGHGALSISYANAASGLDATNVQDAIDELQGELELPSQGTIPLLVNAGAALTKYGRVLQTGSGWESSLIDSPSILLDPETGRWVMFYAGLNTAGTLHETIGIAYSDDLITWTKYGSNPIFSHSGTGGAPDENGVTGPVCYYEDGVYYLFYIGLTGVGYEGGTPSLCLATATSITGSWTRHGQVIGPSGSGWRQTKIFHASLLKLNGIYYMFFNAADGGGNEAIGYATAISLLGPWTVDDVNSPVLSPTGTGANWDGLVVGDSSLYVDGDAVFMAYYGKGTAGNGRDGLAVTQLADFPLGWARHASNPVLDLGATGAFDDAHAHKPFIVVRGDSYYHFYTAIDSGNVWSFGLAIGKLAAVQVHEAAIDPHTGYQKESEKGVASGYAGLDGGGLVPSAQLGTGGTGGGAKVLSDAQTFITPPSTSGIGEILISDTPSTPLIFADLIQNEAQDDLVYADP